MEMLDLNDEERKFTGKLFKGVKHERCMPNDKKADDNEL